MSLLAQCAKVSVYKQVSAPLNQSQTINLFDRNFTFSTSLLSFMVIEHGKNQFIFFFSFSDDSDFSLQFTRHEVRLREKKNKQEFKSPSIKISSIRSLGTVVPQLRLRSKLPSYVAELMTKKQISKVINALNRCTRKI